MVRELRMPVPERRHDLDLRRRVGHVVGAAHDMGHAHLGVVDHAREGVEDLPVPPDQDRVRDARRVDGDRPEDAVRPLNAALVELEAPDTRAPLGTKPLLLRLVEPERGAVVDRRPPHVELLLALQVELRRPLERLVEASRLPQPVGGRGVAVETLGLPLDPVPGEAEPVQILLDRVDIFLLRSLRVGIVEAQDEGPPGLPRDQPVEQRGAQVADMDVARGRGREAGDGHGRASEGTTGLNHKPTILSRNRTRSAAVMPGSDCIYLPSGRQF